jgi:hypothetical protein
MKISRYRFGQILCFIGLALNNYWLLAPLVGIDSSHLVSTLELNGQHDATLFRALSVIAGFFLIAAGLVCVSSLRRQKIMSWCIMILGLCVIVDGLFAINCETCSLSSLNASGWVHGIESAIYVLCIVAATIITALWRLHARATRLLAKAQFGLLVVYLGLHSMVLLSLNTNGGTFQRITLCVETLLVYWLWLYAAKAAPQEDAVLKKA